MGIVCFIVGVIALVFNTQIRTGTVTSVGEGIWGGAFVSIFAKITRRLNNQRACFVDG